MHCLELFLRSVLKTVLQNTKFSRTVLRRVLKTTLSVPKRVLGRCSDVLPKPLQQHWDSHCQNASSPHRSGHHWSFQNVNVNAVTIEFAVQLHMHRRSHPIFVLESGSVTEKEKTQGTLMSESKENTRGHTSGSVTKLLTPQNVTPKKSKKERHESGKNTKGLQGVDVGRVEWDTPVEQLIFMFNGARTVGVIFAGRLA